MNDKIDLINHPPHYCDHPSGVECIQITEHMNFNCGNAVKYIWRADEKHETPLADLEKARWYIEREIKRLSIKEPENEIEMGRGVDIKEEFMSSREEFIDPYDKKKAFLRL